jgi:hypothetical protein
MKQVEIADQALREAAGKGMDEFLQVFVNALREASGSEELTAEAMNEMNSDQITLLAWDTLHQEIMSGGFVQLIHNGYGPFIFKNPFAKALKLWGLREPSKLIYEAHTLYNKYGAQIEHDCTYDEFMALYEQFPEFEELDDFFVTNEEEWTSDIAQYVDNHIDNFATITT